MVLANSRYGLKVPLESVDESSLSLNSILRHILPNVNVSLTRRGQEVPVICEHQNIEYLLFRFSEIFVLGNELAFVSKGVHRDELLIVGVVPREDKACLRINFKAFAPLKHFLDWQLI